LSLPDETANTQMSVEAPTTEATSVKNVVDSVGREDQDVCARLIALGRNSTSVCQLFRASVRIICKRFASPYAAIHVSHSCQTVDERVAASPVDDKWRPVLDACILEAQTEHVSLARLYGSPDGAMAVALAVPLSLSGGQPIGSLAVIAACSDERLAEAKLGELRALASLLCNSAERFDSHGKPDEDDTRLKRAIVKAADFESLHELAFAIVNTTRNRFDFDQVTMGVVKRNTVKIVAISGLDQVYPSSPGISKIGAAMEECLDAREPICLLQADEQAEAQSTSNYRLHHSWHADVGNGPVASIPLFAGDELVAVLSVNRTASGVIDHDDLSALQKTLEPFGPAIELVTRANRSATQVTADNVRRAWRWASDSGGWGRRSALAAACGILLWFCFGSMTYRVTVPCTIAADHFRFYGAPYAGVLKATHVEPGDRVSAGQVLFELDTSQLELQLDKLRSKQQVVALEVEQAIAAGDLAAAALAQARQRVIEAELTITEAHIAQAIVTADTDGVVMQSEVEHRDGKSLVLGEPMLQIATSGKWSIELRIPEADAVDVEQGMSGEFCSNARPDETILCEIARILPSAEAGEGDNHFVAKADVTECPEWMRIGMEGSTRIDAGSQPVWWIMLHRAMNTFQRLWW